MYPSTHVELMVNRLIVKTHNDQFILLFGKHVLERELELEIIKCVSKQDFSYIIIL
jgi:hypothetical protein